jgi:hypothetical protein
MNITKQYLCNVYLYTYLVHSKSAQQYNTVHASVLHLIAGTVWGMRVYKFNLIFTYTQKTSLYSYIKWINFTTF